MTEEKYNELRTKLVNEFWFLKSRKLYLSAKARIRKIADLDFEQKGINRDVTYQKFNYDKIKSV